MKEAIELGRQFSEVIKGFVNIFAVANSVNGDPSFLVVDFEKYAKVARTFGIKVRRTFQFFSVARVAGIPGQFSG